MPSAIARYTGDGSGKMARAFSAGLRKTLRSYYPQQNAATCPYFGHPADTFVERVLNAASNAAADMMWQESNVTRQELRAEQKNVLESLKATQGKLRKLSLPLSALLVNGADPKAVADSLEIIICQIEATTHTIEALPRRMRPDEAQNKIALDMAICVLPILEEYGLNTGATFDKDVTAPSDAVVILKAIGDDIGLVLNECTWRDIIAKSKNIPKYSKVKK